ncbi:MAG: hypothetical protein GDA36_03515 [Rhodobacteraceae bacterium]|nr:hypothetical protein [Paracoccaceae bacterium]
MLPLADLATAAELGRNHKSRRIPDLNARPDKIGRLSAVLRGMVNALYNRFDRNEQFVTDVAREWIWSNMMCVGWTGWLMIFPIPPESTAKRRF